MTPTPQRQSRRCCVSFHLSQKECLVLSSIDHLSSGLTLAGYPIRTTSRPRAASPSTMLSVAALVPAHTRIGPMRSRPERTPSRACGRRQSSWQMRGRAGASQDGSGCERGRSGTVNAGAGNAEFSSALDGPRGCSARIARQNRAEKKPLRKGNSWNPPNKNNKHARPLTLSSPMLSPPCERRPSDMTFVLTTTSTMAVSVVVFPVPGGPCQRTTLLRPWHPKRLECSRSYPRDSSAIEASQETRVRQEHAVLQK